MTFIASLGFTPLRSDLVSSAAEEGADNPVEHDSSNLEQGMVKEALNLVDLDRNGTSAPLGHRGRFCELRDSKACLISRRSSRPQLTGSRQEKVISAGCRFCSCTATGTLKASPWTNCRHRAAAGERRKNLCKTGQV